jgi:hypothetical protein
LMGHGIKSTFCAAAHTSTEAMTIITMESSNAVVILFIEHLLSVLSD